VFFQIRNYSLNTSSGIGRCTPPSPSINTDLRDKAAPASDLKR
jgi:hypothetical protein